MAASGPVSSSCASRWLPGNSCPSPCLLLVLRLLSLIYEGHSSPQRPHLHPSTSPPLHPCLPPLTCDKRSGNTDGVTRLQRQNCSRSSASVLSFEIRPAGGKALLRHPECVMHYLINTNAAVWPLQDDWLVLSRPLKQTLSPIVRVKTFKRASRLQNPKRFLPLAEPSACVAS